MTDMVLYLLKRHHTEIHFQLVKKLDYPELSASNTKTKFKCEVGLCVRLPIFTPSFGTAVK